MMGINIFPKRVRNFRQAILLIVFGASIGYLFGLVFLYDSENDSLDHIRVIDHGSHNGNIEDINLRCVIIMHKSSVHPEKIVSAFHDGYTKLCNETIYYSSDEIFVKKMEKNHTIRYLREEKSSHFFWDFYQKVIEDASKPAAQWTFIGDDQTYLVVPNLKSVLATIPQNQAMLLGKVASMQNGLSWVFPFSSYRKIEVRAGVVFSGHAMEKLVQCKGSFFPRATEFSLFDCSSSFGVRIIDPFDEDSNRLFNSISPKIGLTPTNNMMQKVNSFSDHAITFGQLSEKDMRVLEFGMRVKIFGRGAVEFEEASNSTDLN